MLTDTAAVTAENNTSSPDLRLGDDVALNTDGTVLVASGAGRYANTGGDKDPSNDTLNTWTGRAFVFVDDDGWTSAAVATAALRDVSSSANGADVFGQRVAVSDSGDRVLVADGFDSANDYAAGQAHLFLKPPSGWADSRTPVSLTSPQDGAQLFFGADVAIDGENTAVIGQPEQVLMLEQVPGGENIVSGPGRAFSVDTTNPLAP